MSQGVTKKAEEIVVATKNIKKEQEELRKSIEKSNQAYNTALDAIGKYMHAPQLINEDIDKIIANTIRLNVDVEKLAKAHKDGYEYLTKKNKAELEANAQQIEALSKNIEKNKELVGAYKSRNELIVEQGMIAKAQLREEYDLLGQALIGRENYDAEYSRLMTEQSEKELAIDKQTKDQLLQNSLELHTAIKTQGKAFVDSVTEHVDKVVTHTSGMWKGVIDLGAQKEHLEKSKEQLKDYLEKLKEFGERVKSEYAIQLNDYTLSIEERKQLEAEREAFTQKHNKLMEEETKRVNTELEKIEKNSQAMRLKQFNQYVERYQAVNAKIKDATTAVSNMFKSFVESKDAEIKALTDETADLTVVKDSEEYEKGKAAEDSLTKLKSDKAAAEEKYAKESNELNKQAIEDIDNKIKAEERANQSSLALYRDTNKRETEAAKEKRKLEQEKRKIEKIQKKIDLGQQIVTAVGDIAAGSAKALSYGPILGPVLAAIVATAGAVQIAIMTKQLAKFEDGGLLRGRRHSQGGMRIEGSNIEVEGGEYVVNRQSTDKNIGLIRYINSQRRELSPADISSFFARTSQGFEPPFSRAFEAGGQLPVVDSPSTVDNEYLVDAIRSIRIEPRVAVTDINRVQSEVVSVDNWVGL